MRLFRLAAAVFTAGVALAGVWIVGGNAVASQRERAVEKAYEGTFGPRAALEAKYAVAAPNADAKKAEELGRAVGYDLAPRKGRITTSGLKIPESDRAAVSEYVAAQVSRTAAGVELPPPVVAAVLSSRRAALASLEDALVEGEAPRWACDPHVNHEERVLPNMVGHIQLQRLLVADALAASARGDAGAAARILEASWKMNEGLTSRPEIVAQLLAIAVARYEAGALRRINISAEHWALRLAAMGSRAHLVEAIVLDQPRPADMAARYRGLRPAGVGWWAYNLASLLEEPRERLANADYGEAWVRAIAGLRDEPAFGESAPDPKPGRSFSDIMLSISIPNIRNSFERADRLALDAELTGKILRLREVRRASGAWPAPSPDIASSRFPGLTWNYSADVGAMAIALNRDLPKPKAGLVLPTSFSSRVPAP